MEEHYRSDVNFDKLDSGEFSKSLLSERLDSFIFETLSSSNVFVLVVKIISFRTGTFRGFAQMGFAPRILPGKCASVISK